MAEQGEKVKKVWYKRWWVWVVAAFLVIGIVGSATEDNTESGSGDDSAQTESNEASNGNDDASSSDSEDASEAHDDDCGTQATDDCTPHVGSKESVRVDALVWELESVSAEKTLGDQQFGLGAEADGMFVIARLRVTSDRDESATLSQDLITLETGDGNSYDPDLDGTTAAITSGEEPFFFESLGPDVTKSGIVVFDVPETILADKLELRFGELGFGETHGYIRVPNSPLR